MHTASFLQRLSVLSSQLSAAPASQRGWLSGAAPVAVIFGAGDGIGQAVARRFAGEGFTVCLVRRERHAERLREQAAQLSAESGGAVHAMPGDARLEADVQRIVAAAEALGPVAVALHNIGANVRMPVGETSTQLFTKVWEMACLSGLLVGRECARVMAPRGAGTLLFSGATASMRGGSGYAAFAGAKGGLRMVAQALARELGPQGVHVAHLVIDGPVDSPFVRENFGAAEQLADRLIKPDSIADAFYFLHSQPRDAWTFEMDVRAAVEPW